MKTQREVGGSRYIKEVEDCFSEPALLQKREEVEKVMKSVLRKDISGDSAERFIGATLHDDVANIVQTLCCRDALRRVVIPELRALTEVLMRLALKEAETVQVSYDRHRNHDPITFGFVMANYVGRIGDCIVELERRLIELQGKLSGPTGAYNASSLFHSSPETFERMVLDRVHLKPAHCSPQDAPSESLVRLMHEIMFIADVMSDIARTMEHLQRPEVGELIDKMEGQYGESFHFIAGLRRTIAEHLVAVRLDHGAYQTCINMVTYMARKLRRAMKRVKLDRVKISENLDVHRHSIAQNALCVMLTALGHPHAHEKTNELFMCAQKDGSALDELARNDAELHPYFEMMTVAQKMIFLYPKRLYVGCAPRHTQYVVDLWARTLNIKL